MSVLCFFCVGSLFRPTLERLESNIDSDRLFGMCFPERPNAVQNEFAAYDLEMCGYEGVFANYT